MDPNAGRHLCSCGRSFPTADGLKRHGWVTKHEPAPDPEAAAQAASDSALEEALKVLKEKQALQNDFDQKRRQKRRMRRRLMNLEYQLQVRVERVLQWISEMFRFVGESAMLAARILFVVTVLIGMVLAGMGVGHLMQ